MASIRIVTPAKAILAGEHFVLHGVPAVAVPVFERTLALTAELHDDDGDGGDATDALRLPETLAPLAELIDEALNRWLRGRVTMDAESTIPTGAGLGSSAARAVAVARALVQFAADRRPGELPALATVDRELMVAAISGTIEQAIHGRASGIDTAAIRRERPIRLDLEAPGKATVSDVKVGRPARFLLIDSGLRRATSAQIELVSIQRNANPDAFARQSGAAQQATLAVIQALGNGDALILHAAIADLGRILAGFSLEPVKTDAIRAALQPLGVAIKITGAGGGGFLLGHAVDPEALPRAVETLGANGLAEAFCFDVPATESPA